MEDVFGTGSRRQPRMRKKPDRRKSEKLARFRRDGNVEAGEDCLAAGRSIQINNRRHESPGRRLAHDVHVQREGITPVGQITFQPQMLKGKTRGPEGRPCRSLISIEMRKKYRHKNLVLIGPMLRNIKLNKAVTGITPTSLNLWRRLETVDEHPAVCRGERFGKDHNMVGKRRIGHDRKFCLNGCETLFQPTQSNRRQGERRIDPGIFAAGILVTRSRKFLSVRKIP